MKQILTILLITFFSALKANAENAGASQTIQLHLLPVINFQSANKSISVNTKSAEVFTVQSNKNFKITVNTISADQHVKVSLVNTTASGSNNNNLPVTATAQDIISNCSRGDQSFAVNYNTKKSAVVVYTATEL